MSEFTDRIPEEVYEPHDELVVEVHVAFCIGVQFSEAAPLEVDEWVEALRQNVNERLYSMVRHGNVIERDDITEWSVVDVVPAPPTTLEEYIASLIDVAAKGQADTPEAIAAFIREWLAIEGREEA